MEDLYVIVKVSKGNEEIIRIRSNYKVAQEDFNDLNEGYYKLLHYIKFSKIKEKDEENDGRD